MELKNLCQTLALTRGEKHAIHDSSLTNKSTSVKMTLSCEVEDNVTLEFHLVAYVGKFCSDHDIRYYTFSIWK